MVDWLFGINKMYGRRRDGCDIPTHSCTLCQESSGTHKLFEIFQHSSYGSLTTSHCFVKKTRTDHKYMHQWKMEVVSGALDGTYIKVNVSVVNRPRYRTRKGEIATNVLAECDQNGEFIFVLPGWEGSAADSRVLRVAVSRPYKLRVPKEGNDTIYPIGVEQKTHRQLQENFSNMKHSSARNVIERAFGLLKGRWAILRGKSFYPIQVQCRTISACCLIHNLIIREMGIDAIFDMPDEENSASVGLDGDHIEFVESSKEWTKFRDDLAVEMFTQWQRA
ncbi:putative nuclease HARBI1 [Benincasa hispida]|uniref:putative nuclease HARBI1 n=1 Tax=Benincasa hispida TaxID=102211 RepID=UPI0018FF6F2D|nr:putative nuclease HARBI1 [Benincasa hispida]